MEAEEIISISKKEYLELKSENEYLKQQLAELKRMIFGAKSERFIPQASNQISLFELPEAEPEPQKEEITYTRTKSENKKQPVRTELPAHLPRVDEVIEPEVLPDGAKKIGENITEVLEYKPANIYVRRIIRPKYILSQTDEQTQIITAALPSIPIPRSNAGEGLLSHLIVSKFVDHLPFYRQSQMFKRQGITIAESTMGGWFSGVCRLLEPIYQVLKQDVFSGDYLQADETPIPVLTQDKPGATHKGYHWVYHNPVTRQVLFDYQKSRGREGPEMILENFSGYLQTDGYSAYSNLKRNQPITLLACMAHARRKFEHAKDNHPALAQQALAMFSELYDIERKGREAEFTFDQLKKLRQKESMPVLDKLHLWLQENIITALPKSSMGIAIGYTLKLWSRLIRYTEDGRFQIDNNLIENSIRPVALGRKNYLFAGSHEAAQNAAMIYSFFACCKVKNIDPFIWLKETLSKIHTTPKEDLYKLIP